MLQMVWFHITFWYVSLELSDKSWGRHLSILLKFANIENVVLMFGLIVLLDKTELETAQQFLDQASQQNLVCISL